MSSSVNSVEDICNLALAQVGYRRRIGSIYEGTAASRLALDVYAQSRDNLLRAKDWPFALRQVPLATNGQTPPSPWAFEYTWPADCLRIRYLQPGAITLPDNDPHPVLFTEFNDQRLSPAARVILSNIANAVLDYVGQVTDMTQWSTGFTDSLINVLGRRFVLGLGGDWSGAKTLDGEMEMAIASGVGADSAQAPLDSPLATRQPQG